MHKNNRGFTLVELSNEAYGTGNSPDGKNHTCVQPTSPPTYQIGLPDFSCVLEVKSSYRGDGAQPH